MEIKTEDGIGKGMPLSDIQKNNRLLNRLVILGWAAFAYLIIMTIYIIYNNVLNNIVAKCVC